MCFYTLLQYQGMEPLYGKVEERINVFEISNNQMFYLSMLLQPKPEIGKVSLMPRHFPENIGHAR